MGNLSLGSTSKGEEEEVRAAPKLDLGKDSQEAVAAVASNTARASEDGKYPGKDSKLEKKTPHLPPVNGEVLRTAAGRHRQGQMVPALHQLLTTGELLFPVLLEEQGEGGASRMAGGVHLVFRTLRRRVYGILFNEHHRVFTQGRQEEELVMAKTKVSEIAKKLAAVKPDSIVLKNKEPRPEKEVLGERLEAASAVVDQLVKAMGPAGPGQAVIKEWLPYSRYMQADMVTPLALDWPVPTVQRLWFAAGVEDKQRRLRAFLSVMGADNPLMLQTSYVPQHLLLMATVLRYIMRQTDLLRKPELDSFLITAFSPELMDADYLARSKLDLITPRGVQLATLFMEGVEMALLANDACGAPVPFLMCCPWLFFDGKLFHSKLRHAVSASNLLEMCDHRMELVVKVERMRRAILEGLLPEFSAYNVPPAMMHQNMNIGNSMNMNMNRIMGMNMNMNMGTNMNPWGPNTRGMGGPGGLMARGGQLVVAGSVVGQWGANWGRGGGPMSMHHQRGLTQQRMRGNRGGKKVREKKEEEGVKKENEKIKILTKENAGKENQEEADVVV